MVWQSDNCRWLPIGLAVKQVGIDDNRVLMARGLNGNGALEGGRRLTLIGWSSLLMFHGIRRGYQACWAA